jgi:hypothetical protein
VRLLAALLRLVHTGSEVTVGEGARRLLHSSRSGRLHLRSCSWPEQAAHGGGGYDRDATKAGTGPAYHVFGSIGRGGRISVTTGRRMVRMSAFLGSGGVERAAAPASLGEAGAGLGWATS